jgi:hypothetical protein
MTPVQSSSHRPIDYDVDVEGKTPKDESAGAEFQRRAGGDAPAARELLAAAGGTDLLFAMQVYMQESQLESGKEAILSKKQQIEVVAERIKTAIEAAEKAAEKKGFWGGLVDKLGAVAKVAAVVAAVASVVATGGLSLGPCLALAGVLVSAMAKPLSEATGISEEAFLIAGAALSAGGGLANIAGGALGAAGTSAQASGQLAEVAKGVAAGATVVQGGATAASGYAIYKRDTYGAKELDANADQVEASTKRRAMNRQFDELVEMLKEVQKSFDKAKQSLGKAIENEAASNLTLVTMGARA